MCKFGFVEMFPLTRRAGRPLPAVHQHTNKTFKFGFIGEIKVNVIKPSPESWGKALVQIPSLAYQIFV